MRDRPAMRVGLAAIVLAAGSLIAVKAVNSKGLESWDAAQVKLP